MVVDRGSRPQPESVLSPNVFYQTHSLIKGYILGSKYSKYTVN